MAGSIRVKVARKVEEIPRGEWDSVFPPCLENYAFFKSIDESAFDQFSFYYIIVYEDGIPVGATSCFLMEFPLDMIVQGPLKGLLDGIKKLLPGIFAPKVLMCGMPMAQGRMGIAAKNGKALDMICERMEKIAEEEKASLVIFKDFSHAYDEQLRPLYRKGFIRIASLPSTDMEVRFDSFEEYLKTLSRVSREGIRRKFKQVDGKVPIEMEAVDALDEGVSSEAYALYLQTFHRQDMGMEKVPRDFFRNVARNMPGGVKFFLWRIQGRLVAFAFCLIGDGHFIDYYLGFDYSVSYQYHLYFVRFRDLMKWCIAAGMRKYEMGVTSYETKRRLGFDFIPLYFYMKHRNPLINPFFKLGTCLMKPENFDPVFKEMKKEKAVSA